MPQYMMLIYLPAEGSPLLDEEMAEQHVRWGQFTQGLRDDGLFVAGDALQGTDVATTVRVRGGETQVTDGPFAETREYLAGYYVLEAPDLDTVVDRMPDVPSIGYGSVEIRPIQVQPDMSSAAGEVQAQA